MYGNANTTGTVATYGVYGVSASQFTGSAGVYGYNAQDAISDPRIFGVYGALKVPAGGAGVGGTGGTISTTGSDYAAIGTGVWGDADPQERDRAGNGGELGGPSNAQHADQPRGQHAAREAADGEQ